jgi:hypothetical protein
MQNVFDSDPPFAAGAFENNYDESLATIKGRFWYVSISCLVGEKDGASRPS